MGIYSKCEKVCKNCNVIFLARQESIKYCSRKCYWIWKKWEKHWPLSEKTKEKIRIKSKLHRHTDETKKKISEAWKWKIHSLELIAKQQESRKWYRHSQETKDKISKSNKWKNSWRKFSKETIEKFKNRKPPMLWKKHSEESRLKMSNSRTWKYSWEKSWNWQGGISFEQYSVDWTETLRRSIRERDWYVCQMPWCNKQQWDVVHHIHHIDYNKHNCDPSNLITLCISCHMKTNFNRSWWINQLSSINK
jgi:hypothetical protein